MATEPRRYVFAPVEHRGLIAGLTPAQVGLLAAGLVTATVVLRVAPSAAGVVAAIVVMLLTTAAAFAPVGGRPVEQWVPTAARRVFGTHRHRLLPAIRPPRSFGGLLFEEMTAEDGPPIAVVVDKRQGTLTAVLPVRGRSFTLLDAADKERRLDAWSSVLSALSREGSPIRSIQWVERTVPGDADELARHYESLRTVPTDSRAARSYAALVAEAGPLGQEHECFVALSVRQRASFLRELTLLHGQLRAADLDVGRALGSRELGAAIRAGFDPWARSVLALRQGCAPAVAWPVSADEGWATWHTDDTWHATYWLGEWPRTEVGPDFLAPLLLHTSCQRTVSVIMSPLPPSAGFREAESARTAQAADEQLRQQAGFLATARRRRQAEGIARREAELSDGHAAYRFSGFVTVTAHGPEELDLACGEVEQAAHQCRLEPRRLYGIQDLGFCWTLPLGRGVAGR